MNIIQEVYFELGKLNIQLKQIKKLHFLLPMIVRNGVISLNCNAKRIDFETLFAPNVVENPSKEVMLIVKMIKTINDLTANSEFSIKTVKEIVKSFDKNANLDALDNIEFSYEFECLYQIYNAIFKKTDEISMLAFSVVANLFFIKADYLPLPMLDIAKALEVQNEVSSITDFYSVLLYAIKGTENLIFEHKKLIKSDLQLSQKANMKSVVAEYEYLLENPVIEVGSMLEDLQMTFATLSKATAILENDKILLKIAGSQRYRIFKYDALCKLFSS